MCPSLLPCNYISLSNMSYASIGFSLAQDCIHFVKCSLLKFQDFDHMFQKKVQRHANSYVITKENIRNAPTSYTLVMCWQPWLSNAFYTFSSFIRQDCTRKMHVTWHQAPPPHHHHLQLICLNPMSHALHCSL